MEEPIVNCQFCPHPIHTGEGHNQDERCPLCRCKGKQRWWQSIVNSLGNAIGEAKFGD